MTKIADAQTETHQIDPALAHRLYLEGRALSEKVYSYLKTTGAAERSLLDPVARMAHMTESMRMALRSQYSLCWLLSLKAIASGEMKLATALAQNFDLKSLKLGERGEVNGAERLSPSFIALCEETERFYERLDRLDDRLYGSVRA